MLSVCGFNSHDGKQLENEVLLSEKITENLQVVIVSQPGAWQQFLQKSVECYPFAKVARVVNGGLSAVQIIKEIYPDLVLIDSSIALDDVITLVQYVKEEHPEVLSIVIADTMQQRRQINLAGADFTLSVYDCETQIRTILNDLWANLSQNNGLRRLNI